jgi:type VI secretion system protein
LTYPRRGNVVDLLTIQPLKMEWNPMHLYRHLHRRGTARLWLLALLLLNLLTSCGLPVRTRALFGSKLHVQVYVAEHANQNYPVAVDLLLVYDKKLATRLLAMSANEWFSKREQVKKDYPNDEGFASWSWEWVPGQNVPEQELPLQAKARLGIIFAHYNSPGEHRARIDPHQSITIELLEQDFAVHPRE